LEKENLSLPGPVKAFEFLLKISPVKINVKNSCPLRDGNHFDLTWPNLHLKSDWSSSLLFLKVLFFSISLTKAGLSL
jgi:hypothetical protein